MPSCAVPVVDLVEGGGYKVNEEELKEILLNKDIAGKKVALISVAGAFRKGKSFLLNFFVHYLDWLTSEGEGEWFNEDTVLDKFHWRSGLKRDTVGMLLWNKPYILRDNNNEEVVMFLMDTQGLFDNKSTVQHCVTVFAMSTLISSIQIFNISQQIQETDLQHLRLFTEYAQLAKKKSTTAPFQKLMFLVRDWQNSREHSYGFDGGDDYLENLLEKMSYNAEDPADGSTAELDEKIADRLLSVLRFCCGYATQSELITSYKKMYFEQIFLAEVIAFGRVKASTVQVITENYETYLSLRIWNNPDPTMRMAARLMAVLRACGGRIRLPRLQKEYWRMFNEHVDVDSMLDTFQCDDFDQLQEQFGDQISIQGKQTHKSPFGNLVFQSNIPRKELNEGVQKMLAVVKTFYQYQVKVTDVIARYKEVHGHEFDDHQLWRYFEVYENKALKNLFKNTDISMSGGKFRWVGYSHLNQVRQRGRAGRAVPLANFVPFQSGNPTNADENDANAIEVKLNFPPLQTPNKSNEQISNSQPPLQPSLINSTTQNNRNTNTTTAPFAEDDFPPLQKLSL